MAFIRTILGDIDSENIGIVFSHEHIVIDENYVTDRYPEFLLNDVEKISKELLEIKNLGCSMVVDTMPANAGRNILKSAEISEKTSINMIVPTGIHLEKYYPACHWRFQYSEDQLADLFIKDIEIGIDQYDYNGPIVKRTNHKAGLIKLATGDEPFTSNQIKIFHAVVQAHLHTGAPILTHTNGGKRALEQAELFINLGAKKEHIVLSHTDRNNDLAYQEAILQTGVSVEYDSAFRWKNGEENLTYKYLDHFLPKYPNQITVGMDAARNSYWKSYGGKPGLAFLLTDFVTELKSRNLYQYFKNLFVLNPKRIFSFH